MVFCLNTASDPGVFSYPCFTYKQGGRGLVRSHFYLPPRSPCAFGGNTLWRNCPLWLSFVPGAGGWWNGPVCIQKQDEKSDSYPGLVGGSCRLDTAIQGNARACLPIIQTRLVHNS